MGPGDTLQQIVLEWLDDGGSGLAAWSSGPLILAVLGGGTLLLLAMFPLTAVAMAAGYLLGAMEGAVASLGAVSFSSELGRRVSGGWIRPRALRALGAGERWQAAATALRERTGVLSASLRLAPLVPYGVGCWLLPLVSWRPVSYNVGSVLGTIPLVGFSAWMGAQAAMGMERAEVASQVEGMQRAVLFSCYLAMFVAIWIGAMAIRRGLGRHRMEVGSE